MFKIEKFDLLISIYTFCIVVSEIMGAKTFPLFKIAGFQINATVAIFVIPLVFMVNDVITEVYGKERARSVIRSNLIVVVLILLYSLLVTHLPASARYQPSNGAYDFIFGVSIRFSIASLIAFAIAEFMDVFIFAKIRQRLGKKALWFRTNASNFASEFLDTMVFMTLAFYALNMPFGQNFSFILSIALPYYALRCGLSIIETPLVYIGANWLRKDKK